MGYFNNEFFNVGKVTSLSCTYGKESPSPCFAVNLAKHNPTVSFHLPFLRVNFTRHQVWGIVNLSESSKFLLLTKPDG